MLMLSPQRLLPLAIALLATTLSAQQFTTTGVLPGGSVWTEGAHAFDANNDGWIDILYTNGIGFAGPGGALAPTLLINQAAPGNAVFADESATRLPAGLTQQGKGLITVDVDGDGDEDIVFANGFANQPRLLINDGSGNFTDETNPRFPVISMSSFGVSAGDLDDDGDMDLVFADSGTGLTSASTPKLFINDGSGNFTNAPSMMNGVPKTSAQQVSMVDVDGDLDLDVIVDGRSTPQQLYINDGSANFTYNGSALPAGSNSVYETEWADLDLDGDIDGAYVSFSGFNEGIAVNNTTPGNVSFGGATNILSGFNGNDDNEVAFLDYDNDGDLDLIVGSLANATEKVYTNGGGPLTAGAFSFSANVFQATSDSTLDLTLADFDNDGDVDVATGQGESGNFANRYYTNNGPADTVAPMIGRVTTFDPTVLESLVFPDGLVIRAWVQDGSYDNNRVWASASLSLTSTKGAFSQTVNLPMTYIGGGLFRAAVVPPMGPDGGVGTTVSYTVTATDRAGNQTVGSTESFVVCGDRSYGPNTGVNDVVLGLSGPAITNAPFSLQVSNAPPMATAILLASNAPANFPGLGGTILFDVNFFLDFELFTDAGGNAALPVFLPASFEGLPAYLQVLTFDSSKPQGFGLSQGLEVWICGPQFPPPVLNSINPALPLPGATVTISGSDFSPNATVNVAGISVTPSSVSPTSISFVMPAITGCASIPVDVVNDDGQIATGSIDPSATVTNTFFDSGPVAGGVNFLIIGTGLTAGSTVTFDGVPGTVTSASGSTLFVTTPPGSAGTVTVVVTNTFGCTTTTSYLYL
jgi:FG-GAP-like repeat/IPT/TIG domain